MITTDQAMHIAGNPDGCFLTDLLDLVEWIDNNPHNIELFDCSDDAQLMRDYLMQSIAARRCRLEGYIQRALVHEQAADRMYQQMPASLRW